MKCPNFKKCGTELTEMKNDKGEVTCTRCLKCNPMTKYVAPAKKQRRDVDLPWTDERVIEVIDRVVPDMIREVLENWHIQKPSVTQDDIKEMVVPPTDDDILVDGEKQLSWRQRAKELGIEVYDRENKKPRLKVDVLKDIENKLVPVGV